MDSCRALLATVLFGMVSFYGPLKKESPQKPISTKGIPALKIFRSKIRQLFESILWKKKRLVFFFLGGGCWFVGLGGLFFELENFGQHDDLETQEEKDAGSPATVPPQAG